MRPSLGRRRAKARARGERGLQRLERLAVVPMINGGGSSALRRGHRVGWGRCGSAPSLAPERAAGGGGPPEPAVVGGVERPAAPMGHPVMMSAQQDHAADVGLAAVLPMVHVVHVAPAGGGVAPREGAAAVAEQQRAALRPVRIPELAAQVEGDAEAVDDGGEDPGVAQQPADGAVLELDAVGGADVERVGGGGDEGDLGDRAVAVLPGRCPTPGGSDPAPLRPRSARVTGRRSPGDPRVRGRTAT